MCQGLGHILGGVGADLKEHHLVFLHREYQEHEQWQINWIFHQLWSELTWASCSASLKDTSLCPSTSILFPNSKMGMPSPAASWKTGQRMTVKVKYQPRPSHFKKSDSGSRGSKVRPGHWWAKLSLPWSSPALWHRTSPPRHPPYERTGWWCCGTCDEGRKSIHLK